jgi:hypothetical protein
MPTTPAQVSTRQVLISSKLSIPYGAVSFNPANECVLNTWTGDQLLVWEIKLQFETHFLVSAEVRLGREHRDVLCVHADRRGCDVVSFPTPTHVSSNARLLATSNSRIRSNGLTRPASLGVGCAAAGAPAMLSLLARIRARWSAWRRSWR